VKTLFAPREKSDVTNRITSIRCVVVNTLQTIKILTDDDNNDNNNNNSNNNNYTSLQLHDRPISKFKKMEYKK
jgi:hypothetical protein